MHAQRGLTLLELLVVLAIIGVAMAGVSLSLRDTTDTQLDREAQRLTAMLEAARAQSRTSGVALVWLPTPEGFVIRPARATGNPQGTTSSVNAGVLATRTDRWLNAGTQAVIHLEGASPDNAPAASQVVLGPEPIIRPVRITLSLVPNANAPNAVSLRLGTDGLRPFQVVP